MNLNDFLIKSSRKDPKNGVYKIDDKIIRSISKDHLKLIRSTKTIWEKFPSVKDEFESSFETPLFEVEYIPFIIHPYELPFDLFKDYALFYLELLQSLLSQKASLTDASAFNICYLGNKRFLHLDLGSLEAFDEKNGWKGYRQFLAEFYFPLLFLRESKGIYFTDLIKLQFDKQWIYHHRFKTKNFLNLGFNIHYSFYKNSRIKTLEKSKNNLNIKISFVKKNIILLKEHINAFTSPKVKTKWDNYYSKTVIGEGYVENKAKIFTELLNKITGKSTINFAVDWGANDGKFSKLLIQELKDTTVISIESDYNAANHLYIKSKSEKIIPVYADILNLAPAVGFDGERESLKNRLKKVVDFQVCLGLIHHLIHQENLSFSHIISFLSDCSKTQSYLLIEFIDENDPRHQLIKNPNYPCSLDRESFIQALNQHYEVIDSKPVIETRELFLCIKRA